jgi:predicted flap endonuclease-1-like 5' DNA nuclease
VAIKTEETSAVVDAASGEVQAAAEHTQTYAENAAGDVAAATEERSGFIAAATAAGAVAAFAHEESAVVATPEGVVAASAAETVIATETPEGVSIEASEQTAAMVAAEEGAAGELTSETVDLAATGAGVVAVHSASVVDFTETPEGEIAAVETGAVEVLATGEAAKALVAGEAGEPGVVEIPNVVEIDEEQARFLKYEIEYVEGIGPTYGAKLKAVGVNTPLDMLSKGATRKGRELIAEATGITLTLILKWVNHCDLFRLKGVGSEFADLLEAAGVDTVVELAQRNPANLHAKLNEVNEEKKLVRQTPAAAQVEDWVAQAKDLPRIVTY